MSRAAALNHVADLFDSLPEPGGAVEAVALNRQLGAAVVVTGDLDLVGEWSSGQLWLSAALGQVTPGHALSSYELLLSLASDPARSGGLVVSVCGAGGTLKLSAPCPYALSALTCEKLATVVAAFAAMARSWREEVHAPPLPTQGLDLVPRDLCA